ncbi:MAG TPA: TIGR02221 family CRISPR-associated protein [Eubacterium sp.]|nr:TIGR02221 family CRISPR-associated protein [Eubacterium sp.]
MENVVNKVLILTLGKGRFEKNNMDSQIFAKSDNELLEKVKNILRGEINYKKTLYSYEFKGDEVVEANFVGEPLLKSNKEYSRIVVIGSSTSMWTAFFYKMLVLEGIINESQGEENIPDSIKNDMKELLKIESKEVDLEETKQSIEEKQKSINDIFLRNNLRKYYSIVLEYGLTSHQMEDNYELIKQIKDFIKPDRKNEVSIDITHSFRSMSFYNLTAINYIKSISDCDVSLKNVFYGNLDISGNNNNVAPITNLDLLTESLDLTNGIVEFKNTGNAITILRQLTCDGKKKDSFAECLELFDKATQFNDYNNIVNAIQTIRKFDIDKDDNTILEKDAKVIIKEIIVNSFSDVKDTIDSIVEGKILYMDDIDKFERACIQYNLSNWYFKQNRYGMAIATALETNRSFASMTRKISQSLKENVERESFRIDSEQQSMEKMDKKYAKENPNVFSKDAVKACKDIRNTFAHNLQDKIFEKKEEIIGFEEQKRIDNYIKQYLPKCINEYFTNEKFFKKNKKKNKKPNADGTIFVFSCAPPTGYSEGLLKTNNKKYNIVGLTLEEEKSIRSENSKEKQIKKIMKYIAPKLEKEQIDFFIMHKLNVFQFTKFKLFLESRNINYTKLCLVDRDISNISVADLNKEKLCFNDKEILLNKKVDDFFIDEIEDDLESVEENFELKASWNSEQFANKDNQKNNNKKSNKNNNKSNNKNNRKSNNKNSNKKKKEDGLKTDFQLVMDKENIKYNTKIGK